MFAAAKPRLCLLPLAAAVALASIYMLSSHRQQDDRLSTAQPDGVKLAEISPEESRSVAQVFALRFPPLRPYTHTRVLSAEPQDCYPEPTSPLTLRLIAEGNSLRVESDASTQWLKITTWIASRVRQPDGHHHPVRPILLCYEAGSPEAPVIYMQMIELDLIAGTLDLIPCSVTPEEYAHLTVQDYSTPDTPELPAKIEGDSVQRQMLNLLYALAYIDSPEQAEALSDILPGLAYTLSRKIPRPLNPWPRNWGNYEAFARDTARELTRTLVHLQENDCFGSEKLAAFINSPIFGIIFGERFTRIPGEKVQEEPIPFIQVNEKNE